MPANTNPPTVVLSEIFPEGLPEDPKRRCVRLFLRATFLMLFAQLFPFVLGIAQGGIIAMFLVSISLMRQVRGLMDENRENIWQKNISSWKANSLSAISVLSLFLGLFLATLIFAFLLKTYGSHNTLQEFYDFILKTAHINHNQPLAERFKSFAGILLNNYAVLLTTVMLSLIYRTYGMVLVISWNACIWAVLIISIFHRAWLTTKVSTFTFVWRSLLAMSPHLLLEALGYIVAALAAVFISTAFVKYAPSDPRFRSVLKATASLLLFALIIIFIGGVTEVFLPSLLLSFGN